MPFQSFGALIDALVSAIIMQEDRPLGDTNPGDLRDCPWFEGEPGKRTYPDGSPVLYKTLGTSGQFWNPPTRQIGISGIAHVVALRITELDSLEEFISSYAPAGQNNSAVYLANVMKWTGIEDASVPLYTLVKE
jgi:hypothetical protein